ncbi:splicing factor 3B subunit 1 isoform X1 [Gadus morhua]|uniref:splicing factor 3B subunit 1 isoform X1 n=2 Tax=Gadus morhua TaxID=8049 RepID=UPI0011B78149|nr:splicing factor 3B subunit 1 isoform X1 [Gadus morhua]XP_056435924.1 splicing factor 3B subunit 1 isoform X1 [Gadus chalcogrammus]XP_059895803.1 splicing factor 3B subunit 1 isoform X1 [Gadus macrocephalus]
MAKIAKTHEDIEAQILEIQGMKAALLEEGEQGVGLDSTGFFDQEIYGGSDSRFTGYVTSIAANEQEDDDEEDSSTSLLGQKKPGYHAPVAILNAIPQSEEQYDPFAEHRPAKIADREDEYKGRRRQMIISPERLDPFADGGKTPDPKMQVRSYMDVMKEQHLTKEEKDIRQQMAEKAKTGDLKAVNGSAAAAAAKRKRRWDQTAEANQTPTNTTPKKMSSWDQADSTAEQTPGHTPAHTPSNSRWDETPGRAKGSETPGATPSTRMWDPTPSHTPAGAATPGRDTPGHATPGHGGATGSVRKNRWDETPKTERETPGHGSGWADTPRTDRGDESVGETPTPGASKRKSRWDETPASQMGSSTPMLTPGKTPIGTPAMNMATPTPGHLMSMTPEQLQAWRWEREIDERNRPLTDEELDAMFPEGYKVLPPPAGYVPIRTPARKLSATPTPIGGMTGFHMQTEDRSMKQINDQPSGNLPFLKPDDIQYFDKLLVEVDESTLSPEEQKERKIMKLLLKIKNGTPPMRKAALRQITDKAREFGAGPLFNQILPLLMSPTLEDQERHLLVKVIDRILYKLDDLVRPYVHKILVVIEPLLIDEDYYARVEGREIISNLAKAAGLATMISTMRPDIDNMDEYVRNTTARAFAVVASALGIPSLLPFLKAVCKSKKSWQARHTGIKIVQQIAILMGCAILPHLRSLVEIIEHGLVDEQQKVRTISALAIAALAEAATPYGIESFDSVLKPLWKGIRQHRGKGLAAFLKAIGYLIPLMDAEYANYYTREVMLILIREFQSPDEEMKKIVLKVVKQCCGTDGVEANYIKTEILPPFFKHFWQHRMALDRRNYRQLVDTTVELANKVGAAEIISRIVDDLKDEAEQYRKMVMETIEKIMGNLGAADIDHKLEEQLIDGILYAFQEQTTEDSVMLNGFGTVVNALGKRVKPYLPQICGTVLWRLNNKSAKVRQQAADLISRTAVVMKTCQEEKLMGHLGVVLYEYLGEEYPEVLGSILGALKAIVNVIGMHKMTPPIKDLLPRLTPILKNRHEKVQENCIDLVGRIADRGAEYVSAREWMRICFELLELLKAHKKAIRRATVNTFGYIAKAIGPHDVLATLLNNLKVQERQNRVCTTVAIAIVAETCSPFTVLPALMNEYRVPELNVQNGVLKSLSFLFEYIGEMGKDYIYAVTPLLEDALMDRDLVHRQTASAVVQHMSLGVYGFGCEDSLNHLLNYVWPNVFETSPHVIQAVMGALEGLRVAIGPCRMLQYCLQGLFHPARKVRDVYWKIYNSIYIGSQDALIAHYPQVYNDEKNPFVRCELEYVL